MREKRVADYSSTMRAKKSRTQSPERCSPIADEEAMTPASSAAGDPISQILKEMKASEYCLDFDHGWSLIDQYGIRVLENTLLNSSMKLPPLDIKSFSSLYSLSYALTCQKGEKDYSRELYDSYQYATSRYLKYALMSLSGHVECEDPTKLLQPLCKCWEQFQFYVQWIWRIFMHLDRGIVINDSLTSLMALSLNAFYEIVFAPLLTYSVAQFIRYVEMERQEGGADVNRNLLSETSQLFKIMGVAKSIKIVVTLEKALMMVDDSVFKDHLSEAFIKDVDAYYAAKGPMWVKTLSTLTYLETVEEQLLAEEDRVCTYLHHSETMDLTRRAVLERLVVDSKDKFLEILSDVLRKCREENELETLTISDDCMSLLSRLYKLSASATALDPDKEEYDILSGMARALRDHISLLGEALLSRYASSSQVGALSSSSSSASSSTAAASTSASSDGNNYNSKDNKDIETMFVENLLRLYSHGRKIVQTVFENNAAFERALKDGLASFINKELPRGDAHTTVHTTVHTTADTTAHTTVHISQVQLLAAYCDKAFRGALGLSENDLRSLIDNSVLVLVHMTDKDVFAEVYRNCMSKRLLTKKSQSIHTERAMIARLKLQFRAQFTSMTEGMLNDIVLADEMQREFEPEFHARGEKHQLELKNLKSFSVQVLSAFSWPTQLLRDATLPLPMETCRNLFTQWYTSKYSHRALKWVYTLGEATVGAYFGNKSYEMQVTTLQAITLTVFDGTNSAISFSDIQEKTGITDKEVLKRVLHSLSCQKFKILIKEPQGKSVQLKDTFRSNDKFTNALRKFRVPMASLDDAVTMAKEEGDLQNAALRADRGISIDAAIVRVMKSRKVLNHSQLQSEIISQISCFVPEPKMIKQRIEGLIEREFLQRDDSDSTLYTYLP